MGGPGVVTTAVFADLDNDGWEDLVVAGEWMGIRVFYNSRGALKEQGAAGPTGLWQTVMVTDMNGDGRPDILAGNWGNNSKLFAGRDGPLKLYVKDLDGNGTVEQLLSCSIGGQEYPFLGKDQLELAVPALKRSHLRYDEVAGRTIQYLFGDQLDGSRQLIAEELSSACFINNGKANFINRKLPDDMQLSPIFSFAPMSGSGGSDKPASKDYLAAGNFYGVQPFEGRYDAMDPTVFSYDTSGQQFRIRYDLASIDGECRDAKWIRTGCGRLLLIARNNGPLIFLSPAGR
jgi:hypothetical protein